MWQGWWEEGGEVIGGLLKVESRGERGSGGGDEKEGVVRVMGGKWRGDGGTSES